MSWPTPPAWMALIGTLATLTSLVLAWGVWDTRKILERMDRAVEQRAQDVNAPLGGQVEGQP